MWKVCKLTIFTNLLILIQCYTSYKTWPIIALKLIMTNHAIELYKLTTSENKGLNQVNA